jgi:hypothetical protein
MLAVTKNRVHFVSADVYGRMYGQAAKIVMPVLTTALAANIAAVLNSGSRNTFTGIKFISNNTEAATVTTVAEGGEYTVYSNCEFYNSVRMNSDTQSEMVLNGDSTQFHNCVFGSLADPVVGDKVRPAVLLTASTVTGGAGSSHDVLFDNCRFWKYAGGTTTAFVKGADADLQRVMEFHDCQFIACKGGSVPAVAISSATLTASQIILTGDTAAFNCTKVGTATGIISGLNVKVATATIGLQAT